MGVQPNIGVQIFAILPVLITSFSYSLIFISVYLVLEMRRSFYVISWLSFLQLTAQPLSLLRKFTILCYVGKLYSNAANILIYTLSHPQKATGKNVICKRELNFHN